MTFEQQLAAGMEHLSRNDPVMAELVTRYGQPTFRPHQDYYRELVESIVSQQLSVKAAASILKRFIGLFGHFPSPDEILARDFDELKGVGLSGPKTGYIRDLAERVVDGRLQFLHLDALDNDSIVTELTAVKGVGVWTVHMFLIFCMGRLDVLAVGDLGVRNALGRLYNIEHVIKDVEIISLATERGWHPYESLVCWYAWRSLENMPPVATTA